MKSLVLLLFLFPALLMAQKPCEDEGFRQFDFWIGEWEVYLPDSSLAGTSKVTAVLDNCVLLEEWSSKQMKGKSFNSYSPSTQQWMQTWVDSQGNTIYFTGAWNGESIEMWANGPQDSKYLMSFTPLKDGTVRQVWRQSFDNEETWQIIFNGLYLPKK